MNTKMGMAKYFAGIVAVFAIGICTVSPVALASECQNTGLPPGSVIWCDSFEDEDLPVSGQLADSYFDFDADDGDHARTTADSFDGQYSLRQRWQAGEVSAGAMMRTFGRNPVMSHSHSNTDFREIYWRLYVKYEPGFQGFPDKLSRATVFSDSAWSQAMIGHVWLDENNRQFLSIDPASGTDTAGNLLTTKWNDFANLRWLGKRTSSVPLRTGVWQCVEARVVLNSAAANDGIFTMWLDGDLVAERTDLNWLGNYTDYGLNTVMISAYWNGGSPAAQERYIDSFIIATTRIGCGVRPNPPDNLNAN